MRVQREAGHALVEVLVLGLLLLVPVVWLLTVASEIHAAALATSSAAREAGFEAARAPSFGSADEGVRRAMVMALGDQDLDPSVAIVRWSPTAAWERGSFVEVTVSYPVPVLQMPLLGDLSEPTIVVTARHVARIDPFRSRG